MDRNTKAAPHPPAAPRPASAGKRLLDRERGTYLKKWTGRLPIGLLYPNTYRVGMSNLGFQLVYHLLNECDHLVCERLFIPERGADLRSVESDRPAADFPVILCSLSFEHDYLNLARFFLLSGLEPLAAQRPARIAPGQPLVVGGGVAAFMNPEPVAPFLDLVAVGEAEALLPPLIEAFGVVSRTDRDALTLRLNREHPGFYAPAHYRPRYDDGGRFAGFSRPAGLPARIRKVSLAGRDRAAHSQLLTDATEFADLYLTELGRGCSRGCRFCTAGFIYRPPRLWDAEAITASLDERPDGVERVGLLGMEMSDEQCLDTVAGRIIESGCLLSFSSLRADRISPRLLELLGASRLKSVAIAPDGASERLRRVINKQLDEAELLGAAAKLSAAGLFRLKLYLMVGLPTETDEDLAEFLALVDKMREAMNAVGRTRGRLCELSVSVNCFVPKPWTPFQYHPFGAAEPLEAEASFGVSAAIGTLRDKIRLLRRGCAPLANVRLSADNPERALFQAVLARGDRRLGALLLNMADSGISWKQALRRQGLAAGLYATRQYGSASALPWSIVDHRIHDDYLWQEYRRAFAEKPSAPCDTALCRRCGACDD